MTHWILQFAWRIAFRCVLHRCGSQDIRCWKWFDISLVACLHRWKVWIPHSCSYEWVHDQSYFPYNSQSRESLGKEWNKWFGTCVCKQVGRTWHPTNTLYTHKSSKIEGFVRGTQDDDRDDGRCTQNVHSPFLSDRHLLGLFLRCGNDPSAGSPTETLLRLHLPLNDEV